MLNKKPQYSTMMQFSLLSISLVLATALSVSAAVPQWAKAFPGHSYSSIEMIATIPSLAVIVCLLFSSWIARKIGAKPTVLLGLLIAGVAGVIPVFVTNYYAMLLSRLCFGIGLGIINSLAVSMIGFFFQGEKKNHLMGFRSGFEALGNAIAAYIAGVLLVHYGWHSSFLIYLIAFPVAILVYFYVPNPPEEKYRFSKRVSLKQTINSDVLFWAFLLALYQVTYVGATVHIAEFIENSHIGTESETALAISIAPLFGLLGGIVFGKLLKRCGKYLFVWTLLLSGLSQLIVAFSSNIYLADFGFFLMTMLDTIAVSYILNIAAQIGGKHSLNLTTSILLIGSNCGILFAPLVIGSLANLFNTQNPALSFIVFGIMLLVMGCIGIYDLKYIRRKLFR